jgi:hypothetical protein
MSLYHCVTFFVYNKPVVKFIHSSKHTENNLIIHYAQNTSVLQSNVFVTGTHQLLVTGTGRQPFPSAITAKINGQLHSQNV